jgi:hypothetical protein
MKTFRIYKVSLVYVSLFSNSGPNTWTSWVNSYNWNVMFDFRLQETIVYTIGELGKEAEEDLLLVVIVSLLETLLSKTKMISSLAFTQVGDDMVTMVTVNDGGGDDNGGGDGDDGAYDDDCADDGDDDGGDDDGGDDDGNDEW